MKTFRALNQIVIVLGVISLCIAAALFGATVARSQEFMMRASNTLLMIHSPYCGFCKAFLRDSNNGETYNKTDVGKAFPLVILDTSNKHVREWIKGRTRDGQMKRLRGTPTFIFWKRAATIRDHAKEIGRVTGYGGMEWFTDAVEKEFKKIDNNR